MWRKTKIWRRNMLPDLVILTPSRSTVQYVCGTCREPQSRRFRNILNGSPQPFDDGPTRGDYSISLGLTYHNTRWKTLFYEKSMRGWHNIKSGSPQHPLTLDHKTPKSLCTRICKISLKQNYYHGRILPETISSTDVETSGNVLPTRAVH